MKLNEVGSALVFVELGDDIACSSHAKRHRTRHAECVGGKGKRQWIPASDICSSRLIDAFVPTDIGVERRVVHALHFEYQLSDNV